MIGRVVLRCLKPMNLPNSRTSAFSRNELLEEFLLELNTDLEPAEQALLARQSVTKMRHPLVLVVGPLRSGTTLFMQWLASLGIVAYPTNLLSRFYQAPIIGAKIQLLLTDARYNFRDELSDIVYPADYTSENGKTKGVLAPNEFWYFWRRFLSEPTRSVWTDDELRHSMDTYTMVSELVGIMDVFDKGFAAKGMLFNYNIPFLDTLFDQVLFIQLRRDLVANVASVLNARKRQYGNESTWYSFKIPEYEQLRGLDPVAQAAGQVYYIDRAVTLGLSQVAEGRKLTVRYEDFCANPRKIFDRIVSLLSVEDVEYLGQDSFIPSHAVDPEIAEKINIALGKFDSSF
jgi:hypothetical protein